MTNVLLLSDIHLSDTAPVSCTESYTDDLFELLEYSVQLAKEYNAITVWAGDVFHLKGPSRNSHYLVQRTIDIVNRYPNQLYIVPGNHDLSHDRLDSISSQPLGVLFKAGAVYLKGWAGSCTSGDFPIYGVPWLQRFNDVTVSSALHDYKRLNANVSNSLVVTHAPLYPVGKELSYENYTVTKWAEYMGNSGNVFYGHVHDPHGIYTVGGVTFCNNGSLSRGALTESHLSREVVATLWSSINGEFRVLPLPYKPSTEVFKVEESKIKKADKVKLDDFLQEIGYTVMDSTSVESVIAHIRTLKLGTEIENLIVELFSTIS